MNREELDKLELKMQDLRMAMDIKDDIENNTIRPIAQFSDGEKIILPISQDVKDQVDNKIAKLTKLINKRSI